MGVGRLCTFGFFFVSAHVRVLREVQRRDPRELLSGQHPAFSRPLPLLTRRLRIAGATPVARLVRLAFVSATVIACDAMLRFARLKKLAERSTETGILGSQMLDVATWAAAIQDLLFGASNQFNDFNQLLSYFSYFL